MSRLRPRSRRGPRPPFPYTFTAKARPSGYQGRRCRILRRAGVPECMTFIVARRSLRKAEP